MKHALLILALLTSTGLSVAQTPKSAPELLVLGASHHFKPRSDGARWNEINPGLGFVYHVSPDVAVGGAFVLQNSDGGRSAYAGVDWTPIDIGGIRAGVWAGIAVGYDKCRVCPAGGIVALFPITTRTRLEVRFIPANPKDPQTTSLLTTGLRIAF